MPSSMSRMWGLLGRLAHQRSAEGGHISDPLGSERYGDPLNFIATIYSFHDWAVANDFPITSLSPEEKGTVQTALFPIIPQFEITLPSIYAVACKDVLLAGGHMAVFTVPSNGRAHLLYNYQGLFGELQNIGHFAFFAEIYENFSSAMVRLSRPTRRLKGPHFLFSQIANYYHWLIDALPLVSYVKELNPDMKLVLPSGLRIQEESLECMGIAADRLEYVSPDENVIADELHVTSNHVFYSNFGFVPINSNAAWRVATTFPSLRAREYVRNTTRKALGIDCEGSASDLIFSVRGDSARTLTNEPDIAIALADLGFKTVDCSQLSFRDQVSAFSKARLIVGQHGGNMANILFAGAGARVIEIFVPGQWMLHNCYLEMCRGNGMLYSRYLADESNVISVEDFKEFVRGAILAD